jgi:hypothetical protein
VSVSGSSIFMAGQARPKTPERVAPKAF